ncbi:hypothetical protein ONZ45_g17394 [Pleurotus djamor]|nr:hypothetical protein ONZ45_g17394 [Pleurotus djamor]
MTSNWLRVEQPAHTSFAAHGNSTITSLLLWKDTIITASDDFSVRVWNYDGTLVRALGGHTGGVWGIAIHEDTLVTVSQDHSIRVWNLETGECTHIFYGHTKTIRCVSITVPEGSNNPLIVTGSRDGEIHVWRLPLQDDPKYIGDEESDLSNNPYHLFLLKGHTDSIRSMATNGNIVASGSYDNTVRVWDVVSGECLWTLEGHTAKVYSIVMDPSANRVYSGSMDGTLRAWSLEDGTCKAVLKDHPSLVALLKISPSFLFSGGPDCQVIVWDLKTLEPVRKIDHKFTITAIYGDEEKLVSGSDGLVQVVDIKTGDKKVLLSEGRSRGVWEVAVDGAGNRCVAASSDGKTRLDVWKF